MCAVDFTAWHFLRPLAKRLIAEGFDVTLACGGGHYAEKLQREGLRWIDNPIARSMNPLPHVVEIASTYQLIRKGGYDVVHVHTPIAALVGRTAAWLARVPVKIYTAHGFYFHERMPRMKRAFHIGLEKIGAKFGDFIMTVSREDEEAAIQLRIARPEQVETIYNGVDVQYFSRGAIDSHVPNEVRRQLNLDENSFVIGFVGRLVREKGIIELVQALAAIAKRHPHARLLIVGDALKSDYDAGKEAFFEEARGLGILDKIAFAGMVDDTRPYLAAMDVFCLPSYREGMPVSLLEAMAMARPCIATNIRGCREEIVDSVSGLLVPPQDADALAAAIIKLIENPELAQKFGEEARKRVLECFDLEKVLDHQIAIYRRLLAQLGLERSAASA